MDKIFVKTKYFQFIYNVFRKNNKWQKTSLKKIVSALTWIVLDSFGGD